MSIAHWSLFAGFLLITMVLAGTLLTRLPVSSAMIYLAFGYLLGKPDAGIATILDMVTLTRLDCALASSGMMRASLLVLALACSASAAAAQAHKRPLPPRTTGI